MLEERLSTWCAHLKPLMWGSVLLSYPGEGRTEFMSSSSLNDISCWVHTFDV